MILEIAVSLLAVIGFGLVLWKSRIVGVSRQAVATTMSGLSTMMDRELDDDAKEIAVRRAGFALIGAAFSIALRFALALGAAALPILAADAVGLVDGDDVLSLMLRLDYIVIVSVVLIAGGEGVRRWRGRSVAAAGGADAAAATVTYSPLERFVHGLAFSSPALMKGAARIEDRFMPVADAGAPGPPIFVTSLARGGTTAVLNALSTLPGIATHTYRDMPFLTAPMLWDRLAGGKKRRVETRDRAHGDGLSIGLDSPEAFEEVLWQLFWPEKYGEDRIALWTEGDGKAEAETFFARHMARIRQARLGAEAGPGARYCSKNNANIARLPYLAEAFPGCRIVIPLRQPLAHAASLHRQHRNFTALQGEDDFIRRYMRDIGHFEFGLNYRPLAFPGLDPARYDPAGLDHWVDYWLHAFRSVEARLDAGQDLILVTQDGLRAQPVETMAQLGERLGVAGAGPELARHFLSTPDRISEEGVDTSLREEAAMLYDRLAARALQP
ncbi:MAG: sulfotransferase [Pseudomonadota bacterium]